MTYSRLSAIVRPLLPARRVRAVMSSAGGGIVPALAAVALTGAAAAQSALPMTAVPPERQGLDIVEHLGETLPMDIPLIDSNGNEVVVGDYFDGERPVLLTFNYYECPQLCTLTLNGMVKALKKVEWKAGEEFRILTVSIDTEETPDLASFKQDSYLNFYQNHAGDDAWAFTVGRGDNPRRLADAAGFGYRYDEASDEYIHGSLILAVTPDGRLSRYIYALDPTPKDMRFALIEAGEGKVGSTLERFIFWCHQYDPTANSYTLAAFRVMQIAGLLTVLAIGCGWIILRRLEPVRREAEPSSASPQPGLSA